MLNILPKGMILHHIVDTLKKEPEHGVVKLVEKLKSHAKKDDDRALIDQIIHYYTTHATARMQLKNLVYNTNRQTLYTFSEHIYDALSQQPLTFNFMRMMSMLDASKLTSDRPIFPVIDLKNLNDPSKEVLAQLKNNGYIFFVSIAVTDKNFTIVTSDQTVLTLIKHGVRSIFYRLPEADQALETRLLESIHHIRTERPILAFLIKKDVSTHTSLNYVINEHLDQKRYTIRLNLN
ncbi:MAG: hypothetical protein FWG67_07060 [Defluviitaleaceae bacterium]|nr:hypothetical protein [Defluviitaleaceae bacterium]